MVSLSLPAGLSLVEHNDALSLIDETDPAAGRLWVDFASAELRFRRQQSLAREFVVRAVGGLRPRQVSHANPGSLQEGPVLLESLGEGHLIDATAGLGQDAFILACAGWQVTLLEQSKVVHALLSDGLRRGAQAEDANVREAVARMSLWVPGDALTLLPQLATAEVIYLDPMFPERSKTARVKKNRFLLQRLHGNAGQGDGLLQTALQLTPKVVVKRPRLAPPLESGRIKPSGAINGKNSRFDIYAGELASKRAMTRS